MGANKYSIFPVQHKNLWEAYKTHERAFWTAEELDFGQDVHDLKKLSDNEMHFIKHVLAFFAQSDGIVNENLCLRFMKDVEIPEARAFYSMQILIETIHAEVYGLLIDTYVPDFDEKDKLFNAIDRIPTIAKKAQWAMKWIDSQDSFAKRLMAFAIVEGIFFSGSFCAIFWLRKRGLLPGLSAANDLIARDEGMHWAFAAELFQTMKLELDPKDAEQIIREAVEIEKEFVCEALPVSLIGMNKELMAQYIEYTADRLTQRFGFQKLFGTENPFDFMRLIDMENKTNFFERRVTEYQKAMDRDLNFNSDF